MSKNCVTYIYIELLAICEEVYKVVYKTDSGDSTCIYVSIDILDIYNNLDIYYNLDIYIL